MRLIDAEKLLAIVDQRHNDYLKDSNGGAQRMAICYLELERLIEAQPIAYDVDKVVEQLQEKSVCTGNINAGFILLKKAIPIVKGGGQGE